MKIQLSEDEVYEIKIPEVVGTEDFLKFLERFNNLSKMIKASYQNKEFNEFKNKFQQRETRKYKTSRDKTSKNSYLNSKEKMIDLMQYCYHGTKEDKNRVTKLLGFKDYGDLNKRFYAWKNRYNIQPNELGFIQFGSKENPHGIKIKNYIIKSYTGMFDENGEEENEVEEKNEKGEN